MKHSVVFISMPNKSIRNLETKEGKINRLREEKSKAFQRVCSVSARQSALIERLIPMKEEYERLVSERAEAESDFDRVVLHLQKELEVV